MCAYIHTCMCVCIFTNIKTKLNYDFNMNN